MSKLTRPRLGRGLSSLIQVPEVPVQVSLPESPPESQSAVPIDFDLREPSNSASVPTPSTVDERHGEVRDLTIQNIHPNPHQPRQTIDAAKIAELAASIKTTGLIQPVVVRRVGESYQLIAGERRWRAAQQAGLDAIPAIVREVTSLEQAQMALVENIQREDLNPIERALSYRALMDQLGLTQAELAGRLGEERSSVANFLRLLDLAGPVQDMLRAGSLSLGHAKLIAGIQDPLEQQRLAGLVRSQELSVRNLERVIAEQPTAQETRTPAAAPSAHFADLEKSITRQLGLRVQLRGAGKKGKGKLVVHYANLDDFDNLMSRLGVAVED